MSNQSSAYNNAMDNLEKKNENNEDRNREILDYCRIESFDDLLNNVDFSKSYEYYGNEISSLPKFDKSLLRGIYSYGFEKPSEIQSVAIRAVTSGIDLIAQAQSGMGKTGAFAIGLLNNIDIELNDIQGIILVNTLEMVNQIYDVISSLASYTKVRITTCKKDISVRDNIANILGESTNGLKPHIIIGTPGRTLDMLERKDGTDNYIINFRTIRTLVLDEADELLGSTNSKYGKGNKFINQIRMIVSLLNKNVQVCLFSATMNNEFFDICKSLMRNPLKIILKKDEVTLEGIKQFYISLEERDKLFVIYDLYSVLSINKCIIYCNSKNRVNQLYKELTNNNYSVSVIHSDFTLEKRNEAMLNFRKNNTSILISTDLLGRGIDIQQISVVINYELPYNSENYIHRIGRSGRHGRKGFAINLVTERDMDKLNHIRSYYETQIDPLPDNVKDIISNM